MISTDNTQFTTIRCKWQSNQSKEFPPVTFPTIAEKQEKPVVARKSEELGIKLSVSNLQRLNEDKPRNFLGSTVLNSNLFKRPPNTEKDEREEEVDLPVFLHTKIINDRNWGNTTNTAGKQLHYRRKVFKPVKKNTFKYFGAAETKAFWNR